MSAQQAESIFSVQSRAKLLREAGRTASERDLCNLILRALVRDGIEWRTVSTDDIKPVLVDLIRAHRKTRQKCAAVGE